MVARTCAGAAVAGKFIDVVGGIDSSDKVLSSAERFDHAGVVVGRAPDDLEALRGTCRLARYAVGGKDGSNHLATVECIDGSDRPWRR